MKLRAALAALIACALLAGCGGAKQSATGSVHPNGWGATPKGFTLPAPLYGLAPTQTMYDAVAVGNFPAHPFAAAGYTAGTWVTWPQVRALAAHAVSIAIRASYHADCLDVEPGDASPSQAGAWARADIAAGFKTPCLYSDLSEMPAVKASLAAAGFQRSQYLLWLAWYRFVPGLVAGYDAVQYSDRCLGRSLDCSTVTLDFLKIAQPPYSPPPVLPVCFQKRETAAACAAVKAKIASQERAAASSERAWVARGCPALAERDHWFASHLNRPPRSKHAYRARALASTTRAMRARGCFVFSQRVAWFSNAAQRLRESN